MLWLADTFGLTGVGASLDKDACVRWVGETYLEAMAPMASAAVGRSEFLNAWKDHLPEAWREEVALAKLTVSWFLFCACKRRSPLTFVLITGRRLSTARPDDHLLRDGIRTTAVQEESAHRCECVNRGQEVQKLARALQESKATEAVTL